MEIKLSYIIKCFTDTYKYFLVGKETKDVDKIEDLEDICFHFPNDLEEFLYKGNVLSEGEHNRLIWSPWIFERRGINWYVKTLKNLSPFQKREYIRFLGDKANQLGYKLVGKEINDDTKR